VILWVRRLTFRFTAWRVLRQLRRGKLSSDQLLSKPVDWRWAVLLFGLLLLCVVGIAAAAASRRKVTASRAERILGWVESLVPRRVAREEIGDAMERIRRVVGDRTCTRVGWRVSKILGATIFWLGVNSFRYQAAAIWRRQ
jgi:hypothetical protein